MKVNLFISNCLLCLLFLFHGFYGFSQNYTLEEAKRNEEENKISDAKGIYRNWLKENSGHAEFVIILQHLIQLESNSTDLLAFLYEIESLCQTENEKLFISESIAQFEEFHGNLSKAREYYLYVFNNGKGEKRYQSLLSAAQILFKQGMFDKSIEALKIILEYAKDKEILAKTGILVSSIHIARGEWEKAKNNYISLIKKYKYTKVYPVILLGYLECLHFFENKQEIDKVMEVLKKYFPSSPEYSLALTIKGNTGEGSISYYPSPSSFIHDSEEDEDSRPVAPVEPDDEPGGPVYIQTGSFIMPENAEDMVNELKKKNITAIIRETTINNTTYFRVFIELESSEPEIINNYILKLKEAGFEGFVVTE